MPDELRVVLTRVQNELFDLGVDLSVPFGVTDRLRISDVQISSLEHDCDRFNAELPDLTSFVLPGGSEVAARLHVARAVCRRAEREALEAAEQMEIALPHVAEEALVDERLQDVEIGFRNRLGGLDCAPAAKDGETGEQALFPLR